MPAIVWGSGRRHNRFRRPERRRARPDGGQARAAGAGKGLRLVDWDTTRLAPAERDLWLVEDRPDDPAYAFFRLRWRLADIASFAAELSAPHADTEDTSAIFGYLRDCLD
jgi:hypothetical protein